MLKQFKQKGFILLAFAILLAAVTGQAEAQNGTEESLEYKQAV